MNCVVECRLPPRPRNDPDDNETSPLEHAIVDQYTDGSIRAYRTETEREYIEYHEGLIER